MNRQAATNYFFHLMDQKFEEEWIVENCDVRHDFVRKTVDNCLLAEKKHGPLNSNYESYAVAMEEFDEVWDVIKMQDQPAFEMVTELIDLATVLLRWHLDVIYGLRECATSEMIVNKTENTKPFNSHHEASAFLLAQLEKSWKLTQEDPNLNHELDRVLIAATAICLKWCVDLKLL